MSKIEMFTFSCVNSHLIWSLWLKEHLSLLKKILNYIKHFSDIMSGKLTLAASSTVDFLASEITKRFEGLHKGVSLKLVHKTATQGDKT
jgi:hypothetical protein